MVRLHSEWDACEKPQRMTASAVELLALSMPRLGKDKDVVDHVGARQKAQDWYMHELKILFGKLKTLPEVRQQLTMWAQKQGMAKPEHRAAEVLSWWLDPTCPTCEGRGKERIPGTPSLSLKPCRTCKGSGERRIPHEQGIERSYFESGKMLKHIEVCVKTAQSNLKKRLSGFRHHNRE